MRKFYGALALTMAFCLISASVFAQDERPARGGRGGGGGGPGGGGPGGFGGFGRGMGMGMQGGASQLLGLLRMEEVRKEVKVSNESYEAVQTAQREAMGAFRDASEEERNKLIKDMNVKAQEYLDELVDPDGMKRLMGLLLQQQGQSAAANELIAKEIGLKDPELKAVNDVIAKMNEERGTKMREMFSAGGFGGGGGGGPDPEMQKKMTDLMADLRKKSDAAIDEKLTADQKKAIEALKGEKFTFPEFGGFGGRGGGGPGGRGGAGGGGRPRPTSDN